jgi:4-alpha-glucanotransferase
VLQLAFDGHSDNLHLPENYVVNTVAYTGTHASPATRAWYEKLPARERRNLWRYMRQAGGEPADAAPALMRLAWSSRAAVAMAPLQDLLNLAPETITNSASITAGKCCWRVTEEMLRAPAFEWLGKLTKSAKRTPLKEFLSQLEFESSRAGVVAKELSGKT